VAKSEVEEVVESLQCNLSQQVGLESGQGINLRLLDPHGSLPGVSALL
jgi:hypothetical protein